MKKILITTLLILIILGSGYFVYSKGLIKMDFLKNKNTEEVSIDIKNEEVKNTIDIWAPVTGDFNGDGKVEIATSILTKKGVGSPMDDGTADEYEIQFSDKSIPPITKVSMGREVAIINEGDLNNDKKDDISTYTHPLNGFHDVMSTYSFMDNKWIIIIPTFGILTEGDYLNYDELQKMVFKEGNSFAYYFDIQREIINNKKFEFYFKVIGGPKGQEESGYQSILLVFSEGKKILEDTDSISPPQNLIYEFVDVNGDGYTDIKWQTVTACGKCGEFFNLYVFDPATNLFKTTSDDFGQQNKKVIQ